MTCLVELQPRLSAWRSGLTECYLRVLSNDKKMVAVVLQKLPPLWGRYVSDTCQTFCVTSAHSLRQALTATLQRQEAEASVTWWEWLEPGHESGLPLGLSSSHSELSNSTLHPHSFSVAPRNLRASSPAE